MSEQKWKVIQEVKRTAEEAYNRYYKNLEKVDIPFSLILQLQSEAREPLIELNADLLAEKNKAVAEARADERRIILSNLQGRTRDDIIEFIESRQRLFELKRTPPRSSEKKKDDDAWYNEPLNDDSSEKTESVK